MKRFYITIVTLSVVIVFITIRLKITPSLDVIPLKNSENSTIDVETTDINNGLTQATKRDQFKYKNNVTPKEAMKNSKKSEIQTELYTRLSADVQNMTGSGFAMRNKTNKTTSDGAMKDKKPLKYMTDLHNKDEFTNPRKWTILLTVNNGFYDMFQNWWWHFIKLNLTLNITVIAEDDMVFDKLTKKYTMPSLIVVRSWLLNMSSAVYHNTRDYKKMVSTRPAYIIKCLEDSIDILYVDVDNLFLKNPFPYFSGDYDMWVQSENKATIVCSGFMAIRSNNKTKEVMKQWYSKLNENLQLNQPALNRVLHKSNLTINRLSEKLFVGGPQFSAMSKKQRSEVIAVHATYCFGLEQKYNCFKKWKLWAIDRKDGDK